MITKSQDKFTHDNEILLTVYFELLSNFKKCFSYILKGMMAQLEIVATVRMKVAVVTQQGSDSNSL